MAINFDGQSSNVGVTPLSGEPAGAQQATAQAAAQVVPEQVADRDGLPIEGRLLLEQQNNLVRGAGLDLNQAQQIDAAFSALTPELRSQLSAVGAQYVGMVNSGENVLNSNASDALQSRWSEFISGAALGGGNVDVNSLVQWVLRESYQETTKDLYFYAEKVRYFNGVKKAIRDELTEAREHAALKENTGIEGDANLSSPWAAKGISASFYATEGDPTMEAGLYDGEPVTTKAGIDAYIQGLEEKLSSVGDDAQLANVDLQNILQKQQQTIQMMSNISKMLHDTAQAIIRKIGG